MGIFKASEPENTLKSGVSYEAIFYGPRLVHYYLDYIFYGACLVASAFGGSWR